VDASAHRHNLFLNSLAEADFGELLPHLTAIDLPGETVLLKDGDPITQVYFPHSGIISLVVDLESGETIEAAMIGRESLLGGAAALGAKISLNRAIVQMAGAASVLDVGPLRSLADRSYAFRATLMKHEQSILVQAQQSAACNITHTIEARLCRWLLRSRDVTGSDDLFLTQEFLAQMLGVRRTSVSMVANTLQQAAMIRYKRGHIRIVDLEGLRDSACECYQTVRARSDVLLGRSAT
jgi:CRP-like cAMP-binding protein